MRDNRARKSEGFTLIETLAVIVILGASMVAALGAAQGIGGSRDRQMAELQVRSAIAHARQLAQRAGGSELALGGVLVVTSNSQQATARTRGFDLPTGVSVRFSDRDEAAPGTLFFDAAGRTANTRLTVDFGEDGVLFYDLFGTAGRLERIDTDKTTGGNSL